MTEVTNTFYDRKSGCDDAWEIDTLRKKLTIAVKVLDEIVSCARVDCNDCIDKIHQAMSEIRSNSGG